MRQPFFFLIILLLSGCKQNDKSLSQDNIIKIHRDSDSSKHDSIQKNDFKSKIVRIPKLYKFKQSSCIHEELTNEEFENYDQSTKFTKQLKKDTLIIHVNQQATCIQKFEGDFKINQDTIYLILHILGTIQPDGKIDSIHSPPRCICRFNFTFYISGITLLPKHYRTIIPY